MNDNDSFFSDYSEALTDLTFNSKPLINTLTLVAGENLEHASAVVDALEKRLFSVPSDQKLPCLYLMDSIVKNIAGPYVAKFGTRIAAMFTHAYASAPAARSSLERLRATWAACFSAPVLQAIDQAVQPLRNGSNPGGQVGGSAGAAARPQTGAAVAVPLPVLSAEASSAIGLIQQAMLVYNNLGYSTAALQSLIQQITVTPAGPALASLLDTAKRTWQAAQQQQQFSSGRPTFAGQPRPVQRPVDNPALVDLMRNLSGGGSSAGMFAQPNPPRHHHQPLKVVHPGPSSVATQQLRQGGSASSSYSHNHQYQQQQQQQQLHHHHHQRQQQHDNQRSNSRGQKRAPQVRSVGAADKRRRTTSGPASSETPNKPKEDSAVDPNRDRGAFSVSFLKQGEAFAVRQLFHKPNQCKQCAARFDSSDALGDHLDWHFERNRRSRQQEQRAMSTQWYELETDWVASDGSGGLAAKAATMNFGDAGPGLGADNQHTESSVGLGSSAGPGGKASGGAPDTTTNSQTTPGGSRTLAVLADDDQSVCSICNEKFEEFWSNEADDWMFRDAVVSEKDGRIYHSKCAP